MNSGFGSVGSIGSIGTGSKTASAEPIGSLPEGSARLDVLIQERLLGRTSGEPLRLVKFPLGFFFVRARGGPGKDALEQVVASFNYWDLTSGKFLDLLFPGWSKDDTGKIHYDDATFVETVRQIQSISTWLYSGETDILLLDYLYDCESGTGEFLFDKSIYLPVDKMIHEGKLRSIDYLVKQLIDYAEKTWPRSDHSAVWRISDGIGYYKGTDTLWKKLRAMLPWELGKVYDELRPYAVCDLSLKPA